MFPKQTGGDRRHWLYDPSAVQEIPKIQEKLIHEDDYSVEPTQDRIITFILDHLLDTLPEDEAEAIRYVVFAQQSYRSSGREIGVDHKTVSNRSRRGLEKIRKKIATTPWLYDFLHGELTEDAEPTTILEAKQMFYSLFKENNNGK